MNGLDKIGAWAYASILEMVNALQCDYERLEELRDRRDDWDTEDGEFKTWQEAHPISAEELAELESEAGECASEDDARDRIMEDPLSLQVRSDWRDIGGDSDAVEYCLLLTTGGPAVRFVGDLYQGEPSSAILEVQDWGTPWTEWREADPDTLLAYARVFYYGE